MKYIRKSVEPQDFVHWKAKAGKDWQPSYGTLQNPQKRMLQQALLSEQGWVCCYCGRSVSLEDSHIEHFRPQQTRADLALDYANLHASCIRETEPGAPLHCGHAKSHDFDEARAISPLDTGCEQRFLYALDGAIYPADKCDLSAAYMAGLLKLDVPFLRARRAEALRSVFDEAFLSSASAEELAQLAQAYRQPDVNGRMTGFGHVLSRYAEQLLG